MGFGNVSARATALETAFNAAEASKKGASGTDGGARLYVKYDKATSTWTTTENKRHAASSREIAERINKETSLLLQHKPLDTKNEVEGVKNQLKKVFNALSDKESHSVKGKIFKILNTFNLDFVGRVNTFKEAESRFNNLEGKKNPSYLDP